MPILPTTESGNEEPVSTTVAAKMLGVTEPTVRKYMTDGELDGFRAGKLYKICPASIREFKRRNAVCPHPSPLPPRRPLRRTSRTRPKDAT